MAFCYLRVVGRGFTRVILPELILDRSDLDMDFPGIWEAIVDMLSGRRFAVDKNTFTNDLSIVKSRDDVFTALVHLGYLAYDEGDGTVVIPNEEIRREFVRALENGGEGD